MTDHLPFGADVVVCGAGIAGIAAAWELAVGVGIREVVLVESGAPLSLTSDKSTECYRNWWPGPGDAMVALMGRSIDRLEALAEASGNRFGLNRRGYLYATAEPTGVATLEAAARESSALGAGPLRRHEETVGGEPYRPAPPDGWMGQPEGADLILDPALIRRHFPWIAQGTRAVLHARRCGWLSAQQLGMLLLEQARAAGVRLLAGEVVEVECPGGRVEAVRVRGPGGQRRLRAGAFVNAAGPHLRAVGRLAGQELPVACESHVKMSFEDAEGAVPREAPLFVWTDPVRLPWGAEEREVLAADPEGRGLLEPFPAGAHGRPSGAGRQVILYWTYDCALLEEPVFPLEFDPRYPEIVLRGMSAMIPSLAAYFERLPRPYLDGGYYVKTPENRPLIGPAGAEGAYVMGAFSGFGIMASLASAELLAGHLVGGPLPGYAPAFHPGRFRDPGYLEGMVAGGSAGQL